MRMRREVRAKPVSWHDYPVSGGVELHPDATTPEKELARKERVKQLQEAFVMLSEEQRAIIVMKEYQGLKF